jgi:outer membrane protein assembly factor BamD
VATGEYNGATKTQMIRNANQLRLPSDNTASATTANTSAAFSSNNSNGINIGLGLPEASAERVTSQSSTGSTAREANVDPQNINPTRRTTLENDSNSILLAPSDMDDE